MVASLKWSLKKYPPLRYRTENYLKSSQCPKNNFEIPLKSQENTNYYVKVWPLLCKTQRNDGWLKTFAEYQSFKQFKA